MYQHKKQKPPKSDTWERFKDAFRHPNTHTCDICLKRKETLEISTYQICKACEKKDNWGIELGTKKLIIRHPQADFSFKIESV